MRIEYEHQGVPLPLEIISSENAYHVRLPNGDERTIRVRRLPNDLVEVTVISSTESGLGLHVFRAAFSRDDRGIEIALDGTAYAFSTPAPHRSTKKASKAASGALTAPMVGVVADVLVTQDQSVEKGQPLVILGAMKVYVTLSAPFAGTVAKVHVQKHDLVAHGASVVDIEPLRPNSEEPELKEPES